MTDKENRELENRRQNFEIHVDNGQDIHGVPTWDVFLRIDGGIMTEDAAKLMAAHFATVLGLDKIIFHVR